MNILITGGAGFIGSRLALHLNERGHKITVLDNLSRQIHGERPEKSPLYLSIKDKVTFIHACITDRAQLTRAIENQDVIVHYAAETGTGQSMYEIEKYIRINISGTALLMDILANQPNKVKKIVVASSRSIYGEGKYLDENGQAVYPKGRLAADMDAGNFEVTVPGASGALRLVATDENSLIHPSSVYGITKQTQEQLVMTVSPSIGIAPVAFRYQNVYGPGQSLKNPYTGILSIFSTQIKNNRDINIFEDGKESRDFVYIDDVVHATTLGIEKEEANSYVFNVGTGIPTDVLMVAQTLAAGYGQNVNIKISGNYRVGDIRHNYADLTLIRERLGFEPRVDFEEGIRRFTAWVNEQEIEEDNYERSIRELKEKGLYK